VACLAMRGGTMQVGDLVCWVDKPSLLGVVIEIKRVSVRVQWATGLESNHFEKGWVIAIEEALCKSEI